jgi:hypothetical protein
MASGKMSLSAGDPVRAPSKGTSMNRFSRAALAAALLALSACASVPMAPAERDLAAKQFGPPPRDLAQVYVYRNETMGSAIRMDVALNGYLVGGTASKTFMLLPLQPGKHTLTSRTENVDELPLNAVAGQTYYVWQEVKMGAFAARSKLRLVDEATGRAGVLECSLAETTPPATAQPAAPAAPPST